jgi:hypothetical protein
VLPPAYTAARRRHSAARAAAYDVARLEAVEEGVCGPELRLADIDEAALGVWERTWHGTHPSGAGNWDWPALIERLPRRAALLPIAIWYGEDLCGLGLGYASRRRANGSRHTVTLTYLERRPEPPPVALRGNILGLAVAAAAGYGMTVGARRLRLRNPDRNLLARYQRFGFGVVWKGSIPVYCEKEVYP